MATNYENKKTWGMSKIHVAKVNPDGTFETPVPILGAKSVEVSFETYTNEEWYDNKPVISDVMVKSGSGKLTVMGLTTDEQCLLAGTENMSGGFAIGSDDNAPRLALLFQQEKKGGSVLNVIYGTQFSIPQISAVSTENGEQKNQEINLDFSCLADLNTGKFAYIVNTLDPKIDNTMVSKWFTEVQLPKPTVVPSIKLNK